MDRVASIDITSSSGKAYVCAVYHDEAPTYPWNEDDELRDLVSASTTRAKRPWEYVLHKSRYGRTWQYFDARLCRERALAERWNTYPCSVGTAKQIAAKVVEETFRRLRSWANGERFYASLCVMEAGENPSLDTENISMVEYEFWGKNEYVKSCAKDLADELEARIAINCKE